ncbi:MAG: metal-sensitive transcriptional regulator [Bacillota bacterium]|jgi:DNA-binding FrmR family transcriptional regulator|nr:metal-sensitive transcriptional regulator [Bacillota bacterium]MDD3298364.1 metal-sensitive transcriptional regulator [Bacillota bacterium]MDD3851214.1 metal-sensitive transcriptional regulator [Bacillota bacterium]MDD4707549.1 metal-sensitive transcriptional regulator [Bacillota bacterium]
MKSDKSTLISRLNRIEGQIRGIKNMVENDKYCVDVLIQIAAAKSALNSLGAVILESHIQGCVKNAIDSGKGDEIINELAEVIKKYMK